MAKKKNGLLKKAGCLLISASLILTGWVFFGSITSEADGTYTDGTLTLSGGSISVGDWSDNQDELTTVTSSADLTVGESALADYTALETVSVTGNLSAGSYAFSGDTALTSVTCTSMSGADGTTFSGCYDIAFGISGQTIGSGYYVYNSALYNGTTLVYVPRTVGTSYTIREGTTAIGAYALDDTTITELNFENNSASSIQSIGTHTNWPKSGTVINAYGATATSYIVDYFTNSSLNHGSITVNCDTSDTTTYTVIITEEAADSSFSETITYSNQSAGATISPTERTGYTCSDSYTVTTDASQTHTFTYTASSSDGDNTSGDGSSSGDSSSGGSSSGGSSSSGSSSSGSSSSSSGSSSSSSSTGSTATPVDGKYQVTEGANQSVAENGGPIKMICNGPVEKLLKIKIDGNELPQTQFTIESGSTILTLTKGCIDSLAVGDHVVRFDYTDGFAETGLKVTPVKTTTTVTYKVSSDGSISSGHTKDATPTTADGFDTRYLLCLGIFLLGASSILFSRQKKLEAILSSSREDD